MNSSLRRTCVARGRLVHRSKNLERKFLVLPSGAQLDMGLVVSREKGTTFNQSINLFKRSVSERGSMVSAYKRAAWENANG